MIIQVKRKISKPTYSVQLAERRYNNIGETGPICTKFAKQEGLYGSYLVELVLQNKKNVK